MAGPLDTSSFAETIARYKYSEQEQIRDLIEKTVDVLNPSVYIELLALREICNAEFGIRAAFRTTTRSWPFTRR